MNNLTEPKINQSLENALEFLYLGLENSTEITLSAVYNLKCICESLDHLINTSDLDIESYLLLYEITESLKNDYKYLREGLFTFSPFT